MDVTVEPLAETERSAVAAVEVMPAQRAFVREVAHYLEGCDRDGVWQPFAIRADGEVVGFVMTAWDDGEHSTWIGGLIVHAGRQGRGIGRRAVELLVELHDGPLALSYLPHNDVARGLYASLGFVETGETLDDGELVARRTPASAGAA